MLNYLLSNLANLPIDQHYIVVSEHYDIVQNYLEKTNIHNLSVVRGLGWETGGDLSIALQEIGIDDDIVVMNGDIITDVNLQELYKNHLRVEAPVSMVLFELNDEGEAKRFGQIRFEDEGSISEFLEKNAKIKRKSNLVDIGFHIFDKKFLQNNESYLVPKKFKLEIDLFPDFAKRHMLFENL